VHIEASQSLGGVFRDVTYFMGCFEMCDKVTEGRGVSKLAKNSMTYFMDGPLIKIFINYYYHYHYYIYLFIYYYYY